MNKYLLLDATGERTFETYQAAMTIFNRLVHLAERRNRPYGNTIELWDINQTQCFQRYENETVNELNFN